MLNLAMSPSLQAYFTGIKPAVTAVVFHATYRIAHKSLKNNYMYSIACIAFILIFAFKVPFPWIVLLAAISGYVLSKFKAELFSDNHQSTNSKSYGQAIIDDHTPAPLHAIFKVSRLIQLLVFPCSTVVPTYEHTDNNLWLVA